MSNPTDEEWLRQAQDEFSEWAAKVDAEPDPAKKRRLFEEHQAKLRREIAEVTVEWVERVRARDGDEAAEQLLKTLRKINQDSGI